MLELCAAWSMAMLAQLTGRMVVSHALGVDYANRVSWNAEMRCGLTLWFSSNSCPSPS